MTDGAEVWPWGSAEISLGEFRRRNWFLVEYLSRYMTVVCCAKDTEVFRGVGSAQGKWPDVIDLEIVRAVALVA